MIVHPSNKLRTNKKIRANSYLTGREIQALLNSAGVQYDPKSRPPSGWYRNSPGLTGIGIGRNHANCGRVWKPKGPFIPLKIKKYVEPRRWAR